MYGYEWDYFPARLHSTREIIFFLENIENITQIISDYPNEINYIFGDIYHPVVINDSKKFIAKGIDKNIKKIIMEISSRKVIYRNDIPLNYYYVHQYKKHGYTEKILTDQEMKDDLENIANLCKTIFNENIEIHIIPHLNLRTKMGYIPERNNLVQLLHKLCDNVHDVGKYIESFDKESLLEDYMADSTHYSKNYDKVKKFLIENIN